MIIRQAGPGDADAIADIWNPQIRDTAVTFTSLLKTPGDLMADIAARQENGYAFLVACADDAVLGFATYAQFRGGPGYARTMEHTVILAAEARGRGVGRALMVALEEHARQAGVHSMIAGVSGENTAAIAFHEAMGYARVATIPEAGFKFGRWMDLVLLQKHLNGSTDDGPTDIGPQSR